MNSLDKMEDYDRLKAAYDAQREELQCATMLCQQLQRRVAELEGEVAVLETTCEQLRAPC